MREQLTEFREVLHEPPLVPHWAGGVAPSGLLYDWVTLAARVWCDLHVLCSQILTVPGGAVVASLEGAMCAQQSSE